MKLSREYIERLINQNSGNGGGGNGGGGTSVAQVETLLAGYATQKWTNEKYLSIDFFNHLVAVHGKKTETVTVDGQTTTTVTDIVVAPNEWPVNTATVTYEVTDIEVKYTLWSQGGVSALGYSGDASGGGGGGGGSVTSVGLSMPTGFTVTNTPVTQTGTLTVGFATGYSLPTTAKQNQWDEAYAAKHTHDNLTVLNGITAALVTNWNTAFADRHAHENMSVLEGITATLVTNWNTAFTNNHTHSNKAVLDTITSTKVEHWDTAYGWGNHSTAGYLTQAAFNATTWWGNSPSNGAVTGNLVGAIQYIEFSNGVRIGVDSTSNTIKIYRDNGTAANFYATGGVSALGMSDDSSPSSFDESQMWEALGKNEAPYLNRQIDSGHLSTALAPYALSSQIPTMLKNPYALTITLNGTATEYDGSVARSLTINTGLDQQALTTYLSSKILTVKNGTATLGTWNPTAAGTIDIASALSGYLPLTGGTLTGGVNMKFGHDLTKGDNGITSTQWNGIRVLDKNGYLSAQFLNQVQTDGTNALNLNLRNRNGGTEYDKSLVVYLTKSGVISAALNGVFTATSFNSTVATGTSPLTVASTTVVSNLNADLLDGYHANNVFQAAVQRMANANTSMTNMLLATITLSDSDSLEVGGFSAVFNSREMTNKNGFFLNLSIRRTNRTTIGCDFHYIPLGTVMPEVPYVRSDDGATFYVYMPSSGTGWRSYYAVTKINAENCSFNLETTDSVISGTRLNATAVMGGAVSSAAKLQTTRKIWGQNFDGTQNVSGNMTDVGSITMSGDIIMDNDKSVKIKGTDGSYKNILTYNYANDLVVGWDVRTTSRTWIGGSTIQLVSSGYSAFYADANGNVSIGTTVPYAKLDVNGGVKATKLYLYKPNASNDTGAIYLTYENGGVHLAGAGFYADEFVSALGLNGDTSASTFDESQMWEALRGQPTAGVINNQYIPALSGLRGVSISSLSAGQTLVYRNENWVNETIAVSTTIAGASDFSTYFTGTKAKDSDKLNGQYASYYAKASDVTTLQGYFDGGSANTAKKLKTAVSLWGNSFDGSTDLTNSLTINNGSGISIKDSNATARQVLAVDSNNNCYLGDGLNVLTATLSGKSVNIRYNGTTSGIFLNTSGDVGIGTTDPAYKLSVSGDIQTTGQLNMARGNGVSFDIDGTYTKAMRLFVNSNVLGIGYETTVNKSFDTNIYGSNVSLFYGSRQTLGVILTSSGNVGIGYSSPTDKLYVNGTSHFVDNSHFEECVGIGGAPNNSYKLYVNGNSWMSGKLGVGTTTDSTYRLKVSGLSYLDGAVIPSSKTLTIGSAVLEWDDDNNALKVRKSTGANEPVNLYATGGVSALGIGSDSGGGVSGDYIPLTGSNQISGELTPSVSGKNLGSSSKRWSLYATSINASGSVSAPSISAQTMSVNGYTVATTADLGSYLPLTGGTLSNTGRGILTIHQTGTNPDGPYITFKCGNGSGSASDVGYFGYNTNSGFFMQFVGNSQNKTLRIYKDGTLQFDGNNVLHAGNYSNYCLPNTGGTLTGNLNIKYSHDLSKTDNGVSDPLWPGFRIYDKGSRRSAQFVNGVYSNGSNFVWMGVSNYDTSGNMIADYGIGLSVDKNGVGTWTVSQPAAFRTAIGIPTLLGNYISKSGATNLSGEFLPSSDKGVTLGSVSKRIGGFFYGLITSGFAIYPDNDTNKATEFMSDSSGNLVITPYGELRCNGGLTLKASQYYSDNVCGLNVNNSDIIGLNGMYFSDYANNAAEGINFVRSDGEWNDTNDALYAQDGNLLFETDIDYTTSSNGAKFRIPLSGPFEKSNGSGYTNRWRKVGTYEFTAIGQQIVIELFSGNGYNSEPEQNSNAKITIKHGYQTSANQVASKSVGVTCERYGYSCQIQVAVKGTTYRKGEVWILVPVDYGNGFYRISGDYAKWTHNTSAAETSQTTSPHNQTNAVLYFDYLSSLGGTLTGDIGVQKANSAIWVANGSGGNKVGLNSDTNRGIYDWTKGAWLIATNGTGTFLNIGNVGIGYTPDNSYKLKVNGKIYANDDIETNMGTVVVESDVRKKDIVDNVTLALDKIAESPIFDFTWKEKGDGILHTGTSAQYWQRVLPNAVMRKPDGYLAMDYGATALTAAVMVARKTLTHEEEIKRLKAKVAELEEEVEQLKAA